MVSVFVKHKVNNFDNWKSVYDDLAGLRKESGINNASVHRDVKDPNTIIITHRFKDLDTATKFSGSDELKTAMEKGGVSSPPEIWMAEDIEQTPH